MNGSEVGVSHLTVLIVGFAFGGVVFWQASKAFERFRRARHDFRAAKAGMKTLLQMVFKRGAQAARWAAGGALVVGLIVAVVMGQNR